MIKKIGKLSVPTPLPPALKSPQQYLESITKVNPAWGAILKQKRITCMRTWAALWAASVAVGNGCRISEVLGIMGRDLAPNGCAVVVGSKGSNARMIFTGMEPALASLFWNDWPKRPLFGVTYKEVWDAVVRNGLAVQEPGHQHQAVTHSGRYKLAQEVAKNHGEDVAGQVLGHKSKNAIQYYVDPKAAAARRYVQKRMEERKALRMQGPKLPGFLFSEEL